MNAAPMIVVICGQTATGKSDLAIHIAQHYNAEIISADSRQVFRGLDTLSNKITTAEMGGIKHHMIDCSNPGDRYTVADFQKSARACVHEVLSRGKSVIICGGTGLYIDALMFSEYEFNTETERTENNNRHSTTQTPNIFTPYFIEPTVWIGLSSRPDFLREKIAKRTEAHRDLVVTEIKNLLSAEASRDWLYSLGLEPKLGIDLMEGTISDQEYAELLNTKTRQYAKRQLTWFKRNPAIHWIDVSISKNILSKALEIIQQK